MPSPRVLSPYSEVVGAVVTPQAISALFKDFSDCLMLKGLVTCVKRYFRLTGDAEFRGSSRAASVHYQCTIF